MPTLRFYLTLFRMRLHWFLLCVALCTLGGLAAAIMAKPVFVASAKLVVESEKIPDELATSTVRTQALEHLHIIEQRVLARETLVDMAGRMGLFDGQGVPADQAVGDLRNRIFVTISGDSGRSRTEATLLELSVEGPTPTRAAAIANELVTLVLAEDVSMRTDTARQTLDFFDQEVSRLEQDLARRAEAILAFREEHRDALPDSLDFRRTRLSLLHEQLAALDERQDDVERRRDRQVRLHQSIHGISQTAAERPAASARAQERRRLRNLIAERDNLPSGDPGREDFDRRIASLRKLIGEDEDSTRRSAYQRRLQDYADELVELEDRRASLLTEVDTLETSIGQTPGIAVQLASLQRDHDNLQRQYGDAVSARAIAETGDAIESLSKGQRITVLEQAVPPRAPDRPNRKMIAMAGLGVGIALGGMLVLGMILLTGNLRRPADLMAGLGITPFGILPYIRTEAEIRATRRRRLAVSAGAVAVLVTALLGTHLFLVPLDLLVAAALRDGPTSVPEMIRTTAATGR